MTHLGPTSHAYVSQRLKLEYADWGHSDAPPMLMIHGGRDHSRSWDWLAERFRKHYHIIAPDLRGHGNSDWSPDGTYTPMSFVYDIAQLVHQKEFEKVTIIAHSLGGHVALRFAALYPELVERLVCIEGAFPNPSSAAEEDETPLDARLRKWIEKKRAAAARQPKRYATMKDAYERMTEANPFLSREQACHLTIHGISQNEDGTFTWKFDPYLHVFPPRDMPIADLYALWGKITCPVLHCYGTDSFMSPISEDERIDHFRDPQVEIFEKAGHWLHHDQFERFVNVTSDFLGLGVED